MNGKQAKCTCEKALKRAEQIRQFEIELYWKRSAYFWTFIALAFAGYGALQLQNKLYNLKEPGNLKFLLANLGFVASVAWFLVNRGSKYWQEQWETHVDRLEDCVTGPLYKAVVTRARVNEERCLIKCKRWITRLVAGPSKFSVSKINQIGSLYVTIVWIILGLNSCPWIRWGTENDWSSPAFFVLTLLTVGAFCICGDTELSDYAYTAKTRKAYLLVQCSYDARDCCQETSSSTQEN